MEKERLTYSIDRFDHYYESVNNKCTVFLALSTFIEGVLITAYPTILEKADCGIWINAVMIILLALGLSIMLIVAWASTPFLGRGKKSLLYFGSIAEMKFSNFESQSIKETEEEALFDLRVQSYELSRGLRLKFIKLKVAGILMRIQFFLFIPLIILIICHLK